MSKLSKSVIATALLASISSLPAYGQDAQSALKARVADCDVFGASFRYQEYVDCLRPLADAGLVAAATRLMGIYYEGTALTPDYFTAAKYAEIGAAADDDRSLEILAALKAFGRGTTKNWEQALQLRRRQAQLRSANLTPYSTGGQFIGYYGKDTYIIEANVVVGSNGLVKSCAAVGLNEKLKTRVCDGIIKNFSFLPAVTASGTEIEQTWTKPFRFLAPPRKILNIIPGRVLSGDISASDFDRYKISRTGLQKLQLEIDLPPTGFVQGCIVKSSDDVLGKYACKIVKEKFKFAPATLASGVKKYSKFNLELEVDFPAASVLPNVTQVKPQIISPPPPKSNAAVAVPVEKTTEPSSTTGDVILDTAINRCERIGFKRDTSEFRGCVTEQINLLSK